jgi:hypothetical protein
MLLPGYLQTIKKLDPSRIYVENVRSIYNISSVRARVLCEMAVRDNVFQRKIGLICPNSDCGRIIAQYDSYDDIPATVTCELCEMDDTKESIFDTADLEKIEFYQLKNVDA